MKVDLKSGQARIEVGDEGFDPREVPKAVEKAGFTPGAVEVTAVGEVVETEPGPMLRLSGPLTELRLLGEKVRDLGTGRRLRLTGKLEMPEAEEPARLRVEEVGEP